VALLPPGNGLGEYLVTLRDAEQRRRAEDALGQLNAELSALASTDALTGLPNRRAAEARLRQLITAREPFAFAMADLDRFKLLNDTHGHQAGDEALRAFADVARECMRQDDLACRWGGEEFAFVLVGANAEQALQWSDRLRERLAQALRRRSAPAFTASLGLCEAAADLPMESMVAAADMALYRAKAEGRNRAVVASTDDAVQPAAPRVSEHAAVMDVKKLVASV
jgi:diguanylate cyclase (GGDEF)-like protein